MILESPVLVVLESGFRISGFSGFSDGQNRTGTTARRGARACYHAPISQSRNLAISLSCYQGANIPDFDGLDFENAVFQAAARRAID